MKRVGKSFDLDMPPDGRRSGGVEAVLHGPVRGKHPVSAAYAVEITSLYPSGAFVWMSSLGPFPENAEDDMIDPLAGFLRADVPMEHGPSTQNGVEFFDHPFLRFRPTLFHNVPDLVQKRLDAFPRRSDEKLSAVIPDVVG